MTKTEMLGNLINYYSNGNKAQFANMLGVKPQTINTWENRNTFDIELIYSKCECVSGDWLLSGEGEMLKSSRNANDEVIDRLKVENESLKKEITMLKVMSGKDDKTLEIAMKLYQALGEAFTAYYEQNKGK